MRRGDDVVGDGVIDVTTYPEITDLYLVADVCITDYSSVMFDFTITGKPILFFVPDLAEYRDTMRGTYFDLGDVSPGPMLETTGEVLEALRSVDAVSARFADRYAAWAARFDPWDDGRAAERVVDALVAEADSINRDRSAAAEPGMTGGRCSATDRTPSTACSTVLDVLTGSLRARLRSLMSRANVRNNEPRPVISTARRTSR